MKWQTDQTLQMRDTLSLGNAHGGDLVNLPFTPLRECICEVHPIPVEASSGVRVFNEVIVVVVACNAARGGAGWFPRGHSSAMPATTLCYQLEQHTPATFRLRAPDAFANNAPTRAVVLPDAFAAPDCEEARNGRPRFDRGGLVIEREPSRTEFRVSFRVDDRTSAARRFWSRLRNYGRAPAEDLSRPELMSKL